MQLVISLSFVKLLWPFWEIHFILPWSRSRTLHIFCQLLHWKLCIHSQNKNSMLFMAILSKLQGHGLLKKILDTWRSKVFKRERKEIWTHEGPMCFKRKIAHVQINKREIAHERSSYTIHKKFHTLAHLDQGLWLVSPKDPVFDLETQEEQVCLQLSLPWAPHKPF